MLKKIFEFRKRLDEKIIEKFERETSMVGIIRQDEDGNFISEVGPKYLQYMDDIRAVEAHLIPYSKFFRKYRKVFKAYERQAKREMKENNT